MPVNDADLRHMAHALAMAARGLGRTWPNPSVGCVIVNAGVVVGRGHTQPGGRPHGERMALDMAGARAQGATAYVTLEPCAHHGKTPPCAMALVQAGIARVVTALTDPDPRVAGRGHAILRSHGVTVDENVLADQAAAVTAGFLKRVTRGLPFVTLKLAQTLDARIAMASGESRWITGPAARRAVHAMRLTHDAVLTASGTARADDPDLTARDIGATHQPLRVLLDSRLSHSADSRLGRSAQNHPVWVIHGPQAAPAAQAQWQATGARLMSAPLGTGGHVDLRAAFGQLAEQGLTRVLVEAGGTFAAALITAGLVDEVALFTAGRLIGAGGLGSMGALDLPNLAAAPRLTLRDTQRHGPDLLTLWSVAPRG